MEELCRLWTAPSASFELNTRFKISEIETYVNVDAAKCDQSRPR